MSETADIAAQLRDGLRRLAKAVVVVTTQHEGARYAMAATAVSEISMDPPSLLVCVNQAATMHRPLSAGADFCINILHSSQELISQACAGKLSGDLRFSQGAWATSAHGLPYLEDAQASFMCRSDRQIPYGTHTIFIGVVSAVRTSGAVNPLVYVDGRYAVLEPGTGAREG